MKKIKIIIIIIIIINIIVLGLLKIINKKVSPIIMDYSIGEIKRIATTIINRSVTDETFNDIDMNSLFIINKNSNEEVITITLDNRIINIITNRISDECEDNLRKIEEGKYKEIRDKFNIGEDCFYVPSGLFFSNSLLNNIGPKIPITFKMIGNVNSEIVSDVKEYGINNSLITISLEIKVELMVILPLSSEIVTVSNNVPFIIKLIQGKIPHIYGGLIN